MASEHMNRSGEMPQERDEPRRPFDRSELEKLPPPRADDPPYRSWWVLSASDR
jgi:hypothetical protein